MYSYNIGIDWADDHHDVSVVDSKGKEVKKFRISHDKSGFDDLIKEVQGLEVNQNQVGFCLETNQGILVDFLLTQGYRVYPINPKQSKGYRGRHGVCPKKDDGFDAFCLADALRTDGQRWNQLVRDSELAQELRALVEDRSHLVQSRSRITNQLRGCLKAYYPLGLKIFSDLQQNITLEFLLAYPDSESVEKLKVEELEEFMTRHHYPWALVKKTPESLLEDIRSKGQFFKIDPVVAKTKTRLMKALVIQLKTLIEQVKEYERAISEIMKNHPDNDIFRSLPGAGDQLSAQLASHFGEDRNRFMKFESVQRLSGTAPVTKQSGNYKKVSRRWQCQQDFRNTLVQYAFCSLKQSLWAKKYYQDKCKQGATHYGALRILANKWAKIIYTLWKKRECYQEAIFLASRQQHSLMNAS